MKKKYEVNVDASFYTSVEAESEEEAKQLVMEDPMYGEELIASATYYVEEETEDVLSEESE